MKAHIKLAALIVAILLALGFASRPMTAAAYRDGELMVDKAQILSEDTKEYIASRNRNLEINCHGAQIAVITLATIGSGAIEEYAQMRFKKLDIGRDEDNGVLLLVAVEDKDYYIVTGNDLSSVFTTDTLSSIVRNHLEPAFGEGDYERAVKNTFAKLNETVCRYYDADPDAADFAYDSFACNSCSCSRFSCGSCAGLMLFSCAAGL
ncbi:MAG: TPM domain-containing protein [Clostridia bacterium]|nr:TPM domain-containing protein [Clostridia bacterium]